MKKIILGLAVMLMGIGVFANCDRELGPIVITAKKAIKSGDVSPLLKWTKPKYEQQIRTAFAQDQKVRTLSPEAKIVADNYFLNTAVRLHMAGEGQGFHGIKPGFGAKPLIGANEALNNQDIDKLILKYEKDLAVQLRAKYDAVMSLDKTKDINLKDGRAWVVNYAHYLHYVIGLGNAINGTHFVAG